ncbi:MAG TPA: glycosyltransferase family 2 protein [Candidatus Saccharimonadales bacterium]|nr:glycosyltransferase family 2 protein [Candidatus Saccharimonadales bacterium]
MGSVKPKVAVVTRTKNRNLLLERALKSVQSQTMQDFVQVVINDGGDKAAVEKLTSNYPKDKIVLIHNDSSVGFTKALNQGIKAIDSTYVAILDDDDSWADNCLEEAVNLLDKKDAKGLVVIMDRIIEEIKGDTIVRISQNRWLPEMEYVSLYKQCIDNYLATNCFIYRRDVYDELDGYDEKLGVAEDWDFGLRFLQKYDVELLQTKKPLAFYHHRPEAKGDIGNSVFAGVSDHVYHQHMLANKYLRQDIEKGVFGIGYIINSLKYDREQNRVSRKQELDDIVRLEGHMNHVGRGIDESIVSLRRTVESNAFKRIKRKAGDILKRHV